MSATSGAGTDDLPCAAAGPEAHERGAHAPAVADRADARTLLVDPDRRDFDDAVAGLGGRRQEIDVEQQVARTQARQHVVDLLVMKGRPPRFPLFPYTT